MRRNRPADETDPQRLSKATAQRLSLYLRCLGPGLADGGKVSSRRIAAEVGVNDAQVRRDLAALGHLGQRGIGYDVRELAGAIRQTLGVDRTWRAVLVGVGNLARALLRYQGFRAHGFEVIGLFDGDPAKVGQVVDGLTVEPVSRLAEAGAQAVRGAELGILTVPAEAAQGVADALIRSGVRGILNFAPTRLRLPADVRVVAVDLAVQLEQLAFLVQLADAEAKAGGLRKPAEGGTKG